MKKALLFSMCVLSIIWGCGEDDTDEPTYACKKSPTYTVFISESSDTAFPYPLFSLHFDTIMCTCDTLSISAVDTGGSVVDYYWSGTGISCDTCQHVLIAAEGIKVLTVVNRHGLSSTDTMFIGYTDCN